MRTCRSSTTASSRGTWTSSISSPTNRRPGRAARRRRSAGACRRLSAGHGVESCADCGASERLAEVFLPEATETFRPREGKPRLRLSRRCPFCGAREALIIFGARASSLLSVVMGQLFASRHNDDRKVIAFSDNVQDAAHRAGFIAARTWPNVLRAAIAQVVGERDGISLADLAGTSGGDGAVVTWWTDPDANPGALDPERFVAEFLAPDRHWLRDFARLQREGRLPPKSDLEEVVADRLRWETLAELGYRSTIGRTLERTRAAAVGVDRERFERRRQGAPPPARGVRQPAGYHGTDGPSVGARNPATHEGARGDLERGERAISQEGASSGG